MAKKKATKPVETAEVSPKDKDFFYGYGRRKPPWPGSPLFSQEGLEKGDVTVNGKPLDIL